MARFDGRGVIVTGAAQGIGRGIVEAFLAEGATVAAADVDGDGLERTRALDPARVTAHVVDLADFDAAKAMAEAAIRGLGRVHALVNCAGVMPGGPILEVSRDTFDRTFAVNARAPLATMQVVAPHMIEHGGGAIVNIASANAFKNESP
jgi:NAD(P)-dependent dehydrogenase (short-subunit alcohol dehydrogenase family)